MRNVKKTKLLSKYKEPKNWGHKTKVLPFFLTFCLEICLLFLQLLCWPPLSRPKVVLDVMILM